MNALTVETLKTFVNMAGERLRGDWVLIGGAVLPLLGASNRPTLDIDLVELGDDPKTSVLTLMRLAEELGLPIETINQAGAYFLKKIDGYQNHLCPLHRGSRATIHRPDPWLFIRLKLGRLNESDLEDCLAMIAYSRDQGALPLEELRSAVDQALQGKHSADKRARLKSLWHALKKT